MQQCAFFTGVTDIDVRKKDKNGIVLRALGKAQETRCGRGLKMAVGIYLLRFWEETDTLRTGQFIEEASGRVDAGRLKKAEKIRHPGNRAASLGAGLLLQKMVREQQTGKFIGGMQDFTAEGILSTLPEKPLPLQYRYGEKGKPEIEDFPLHFSLSHSGLYVLCAVSERQIGADIQQFRKTEFLRLTERFFAEREYEMLKQCGEKEREALFFQLWSRKEAYGKLTGQGIAAVLREEEYAVRWEAVSPPPGYAMAVCTEN